MVREKEEKVREKEYNCLLMIRGPVPEISGRGRIIREGGKKEMWVEEEED
jgi:hypothetical protein